MTTRHTININPPFQSVYDTVKTTGLSRYYLQAGIKDGSVPYIRSGRRILVNVPMLLDRLNDESLHS